MAQDFLNSSDGIINGALSKVWQITLTSSNGALKFVNFDPGDLLTVVVKEDASGSNYTQTFPSNVLWQAGSAPNRNTNASAVAVYTFTYDGTNFRDTSGGSSKLPSRVQSAALGSLIGAGVLALTLLASNGNGGHTGPASPDVVRFENGSGGSITILSKVDGSGSFKTGASGALATGLADLTGRYDTGKFYAAPSGATNIRNTASGYTVKGGGGITTINRNVVTQDLSGSTIHNSKPSAASYGDVPCFKNDGSYGYHHQTATGMIYVSCN
jgi:hypothetical protein